MIKVWISLYDKSLDINEIKHAARVLSRYRDARRTRILRIRLRLTVRVNKAAQLPHILRHKRHFYFQPGKIDPIRILPDMAGHSFAKYLSMT